MALERRLRRRGFLVAAGSLAAVSLLGGASAVRLTPSEVAELNASISAIEIRGARLPD